MLFSSHDASFSRRDFLGLSVAGLAAYVRCRKKPISIMPARTTPSHTRQRHDHLTIQRSRVYWQCGHGFSGNFNRR
jgi:hypothetical protein